ncbi:hypothetical protein LCGC14_2714860, partial [marine sediment metagenome]
MRGEESITMNLTFDEGKLFYGLYAALLSFVNRKLKVSSERFSDSQEYAATPPEARVTIRDALFDHRELIDEFPMKEVIGPYLPRLITTVLLPFQGRIIYDGLVSGYNITFGGGMKRMLNEEYKQAKEAFGIITSLGDQAAPLPEKKTKKRPRKATSVVGSRSASAEAKAIAEELIEMTDAFCRAFLNEEYAELCRKLASALARKRPSPLLRGKLETWASGIVRTIGWVNFLHDPSQT